MHVRFISSVAALVAMAGQVVAEPRQPYKAQLARMTLRSLMSLERREDDGYAPEELFCGAGNTCAEACGKGFRQCPSNDGDTHCFNAGAKQQCCPGGTGDSCDNGYFCAKDTIGEVWCCPDDMSLSQCAAVYNVPGGSLIVPPTSTSTTSTSTSTTETTKTGPTTTSKEETTTTKEDTTSTTGGQTQTTATTTTSGEETTSAPTSESTKADSITKTKTQATTTDSDPSSSLSTATSTQDQATDASSTTPASMETTTSTDAYTASATSTTSTASTAAETTSTDAPATGQGARATTVFGGNPWVMDAVLFATAFVVFSLL